jgi:carbonic anhydrase
VTTSPADGTPPPRHRDALAKLVAGNQRWARGQVQHPNQGIDRRQQLVAGQSPLAVILSCIDSRVPPELVFDCGLGDVLAVRSGGHTCDNMVLASVEFGPCHFGTALIVVLGHQNCGAVRAAIDALHDDVRPPGHLQDVVEALRPAYQLAVQQPGGDLVDQTVRSHIRLTVTHLKGQPVLAERLATDDLAIVGGHYDLSSGVVELID